MFEVIALQILHRLELFSIDWESEESGHTLRPCGAIDITHLGVVPMRRFCVILLF